MTTHRIHHGHNIKRLREIQGIKQSTLALELGGGWSQKRISVLESRALISRELLEQIARVLGVPAGAIENFREEMVCQHLMGIVAPPLNGSTSASLELVEKLLELLEENRALYHCLLQAEQEKTACWSGCFRKEAASYDENSKSLKELYCQFRLM